MEAVDTDVKPGTMNALSAPPPQPISRMPRPEGPHALPHPPTHYDPAWRPYNSAAVTSSEHRAAPLHAPHPHPHPHPHSHPHPQISPVVSQPPYSAPPPQETSLPPADASLSHPGTVSAPSSRPPTEALPPSQPGPGYRPVNGAPAPAPAPAPSSAPPAPAAPRDGPPPDFRPGLTYDPRPNGEHPLPMPILTHPEAMQPPPAAVAHVSYPPPPTPIAHSSAPYDGYFFNQAASAMGTRQRRTTRAQQVWFLISYILF